MKKILKTVLPLCLLLAVLATAFAFGASAKTVDNSVYYGVYATTAPTVDGEIDEIWNNAPEMAFGKASNGYIKVMWDGTTEKGTLYLLAVVNGCEEVDFIISTRFYSNTSAAWNWGGNYGFNINANTDSSAAGYNGTPSKADFLTASQTSKNAVIKAKATETGFVAEMKFVLSGANAAGFKHGGFFGIGAFVNGAYTADNSVGLDVANIKKSCGYTSTATSCPQPAKRQTPARIAARRSRAGRIPPTTWKRQSGSERTMRDTICTIPVAGRTRTRANRTNGKRKEPLTSRPPAPKRGRIPSIAQSVTQERMSIRLKRSGINTATTTRL